MRRVSCLLLLLVAESSHSWQSRVPVVPPRLNKKSSSTQLHSIDDFFRNIDPSLGVSLAFVGVAATLFSRMYDRQHKETVLLEEEPTMLERESVFREPVMGAALELEKELAEEDKALRVIGQKTRKGKEEETVERKETSNLEATEDPIVATTEEPPVESEEKSEKPSFMSFDEEVLKEEPALKENQPSAVGSYLDSLTKIPADDILSSDSSSDLLTAGETTHVSVQNVPKDESEPSTPIEELSVESAEESNEPSFVLSSKESSEDVVAIPKEPSTPIEEPPVETAERSKEPSLFSIFRASKDSSEDVIAIDKEPPVEVAATQQVLEKALTDDGVTDTLHQYMQDLAREQTRKRMNQRKGRLASEDEPHETSSTDNDVVTIPAALERNLPEFLANDSETHLEKPNKDKNVLKEKLRPLVRPILLATLCLVISKGLAAALIGRGML